VRFEEKKSRELKTPKSTKLSRQQTHGGEPMKNVEST